MDRAKSFLGQGVALGHDPGNAEISHFDRAVFQHHDIMGLDVTVDNTSAVGMLQSLGNLHGKVESFLPVQNALFLHILLQGDAVNQLHDDEIRLGRAGNIVHRHNIRMAEHGNRLPLIVEALAEFLILQIIVLQYFDCHQTVQSVTTGLVHHSHTAGANDLQYLVATVQQPPDVFILIHSIPPLNLHQNAGHIIRCATALGDVQQALTAMLLADPVDNLK